MRKRARGRPSSIWSHRPVPERSRREADGRRVALHERGPFGIPANFRRLAPRVSRRPWGAGGEAGVGVFWRQNARGGSSFHGYPAKRTVLNFGDSPARCVHAPVASTVAGVVTQMMPTRDTLVAHHLPPSSQVHRRATCTSAKTGIRHNAEFCVLTRSRQGQASPPPPPEPHITRNSSHKHEFGIIRLLGRPSGRIRVVNWEQQSSLRPALLNGLRP